MAKSRSIAAGLIAVAAAALTLAHVAGHAATERQQITEQPAPISAADLPAAAETLSTTADPIAPPAEELISDEALEPTPEAEPLPPMTVVAEAAGGYIAFVEGAGSYVEDATAWPAPKLEALEGFYEAAVGLYTSEAGFGSLELWAAAFGITQENPIRIVYAGNADPAPARAGWRKGSAVITHYQLRTSVSTKCVQLVVHELAHIWDGNRDWELSTAIATTVDNVDAYPTAKARDEGPVEDFAESVTATLWPGYAVNGSWSDDSSGVLDRQDYIIDLFEEAAVSSQPSAISLD